jgi:hypothetical protein
VDEVIANIDLCFLSLLPIPGSPLPLCAYAICMPIVLTTMTATKITDAIIASNFKYCKKN